MAWSYLILFVPFRSNIPVEKYTHIISYLLDSTLFLGGDKDNCRFQFILNYIRFDLYILNIYRVYPQNVFKLNGLMT